MKQNDFDLMFVCTGNTCRSPMAQAIAQSLRPDLKMGSAGLYASVGEPAADNAVAALKEIDLDLSNHRAAGLSADLSRYYIPMTESHAQALKQAGIPSERILSFSEAVPDPYGGDIAVYRHTRDKLKALISALFEENTL